METNMPLSPPNQQLFDDSEGHASWLDWSSQELLEIAKHIENAGLSADAKSLMEMLEELRECRDFIYALSDEVREGLIIRVKP